MEEKYFVNRFIDTGIKVYLKEKKSNKYNPHNVYANIIKQLIFIYGEEKIMTPFENNNPEEFVTNLMAYGIGTSTIEKFLIHLGNYYLTKDKGYLLENIEKIIIDMYVKEASKNGFNEDDETEFEALLYTRTSPNLMLRLYNLLFNKNYNGITDYWKSKVFELNNPIELHLSNIYLEPEVYERFGFRMEHVREMSESEVIMLNQKIEANMAGDNATDGGRQETNNEVKRLVLEG